MATISVSSGSYVRPRYAGKVRIKHYRVDLSQTVRRGDLMRLSTDSDEGNRIVVASADPTTDRAIVGFAAEAITTDATGAATDVIPVWVADGEAEFVAHVQDAETTDNDDISVEYGMVRDATNNIWRVDTSETSAKVVRVLEVLGTVGDTNGQVVFMVIAPERLYQD
jgi:hypothetical protein